MEHSIWIILFKYIYRMNIYIYVYGVIPSGQKKTFNYEHLNFPGKELNVTDIIEQ